MKNTIKRILALLLCAAMLLALAACGRKEDEGEQYLESTGGKDRERTPAADEVFSLNSNSKYSKNPFIATHHANQLLCSLVYENMIELDNDFEVIRDAGVISEWSVSDDGKNWELTVEPGHYFSDGTEVTARDVSYSLGFAINADRFTGRFASFQGASPGDGVVTVALGIGDKQFIKLLNIPVIKLGSYGNTTAAGNTPVGSGPYTYNEEGDALIPNEFYPERATLPVEIIYLKEYNSADAVISSFEDGYLDAVINDPSSYTNLGYASSNEIHTFATTNMHFVAFNQESMLGKYAYFRIAMQYAFDRSYLPELLHGNAVSAALPMYPTCSAYPHALEERLSYNLDTCRRVLEAAGVQDYDEDGQLEFMSGSPQEIELHFVLCADSSAKAGIANRFQADMASLGLKVTLHELPWSEYMEVLKSGKIQVGESEDNTVPMDMYYGEVKLRNNFDLTELLQTREVKDEEDDGLYTTNINFTRSNDPSIVERIETYLAASDGMRATAFYDLCDYITGSSGAIVVIGFEKQQLITHHGVCKGLVPNAGNPLYDFQHWEIYLEDEQ